MQHALDQYQQSRRKQPPSGQKWCDSCNISCTEGNWDDHLQGRKHQKKAGKHHLSPIALPPPDFQGYLFKQGKPPSTTFKQRWFELRGACLSWFSEVNGKPKGNLALNFCTLRNDAECPEGFIILLGGQNLKPYFYKAGNTDEKQAWMRHLENAMSLWLASPISPNTGDVEVLFDKQRENSPDGIASVVQPKKKKVSLNDFELLSVVGRGSYGKVLKVRRRDKGTLHAMKVMSKDQLIKAGMVEYTHKEKSIMAEIEHPFIVSLSYAFQTKAKLYLIMDFLAGGELYVHLRRSGRFKEPRARFYSASLVLAFEYLHSLNIVFRDLKPENVVLDANGYACLTDFGMAKQFLSDDRTSSFCGTDAYLSPEMIKGELYGCENDWWSLGILLYEMLQGDVPFYNDNVTIMYEQILESPLMFYRAVSDDAKDLLVSMLSREKSERLSSPEAVKEHDFFKGMEWEKLYKKEIEPPFRPDINADDTKYFDEKFTTEKPMLSVCKPPPAKDDQQFVGFSFTRESL